MTLLQLMEAIQKKILENPEEAKKPLKMVDGFVSKGNSISIYDFPILTDRHLYLYSSNKPLRWS